MKWALRMIRRAPINVEGIMMINTAVRTSNKLSSTADRTAPPNAPTKKT